jgi:hypothetical protein
MYNIINDKTGSVVSRIEDYQAAVQRMSDLNCGKGLRNVGRSWVSGIERQLCANRDGNHEYGKFIILYKREYNEAN